jgi:hypothetical protein
MFKRKQYAEGIPLPTPQSSQPVSGTGSYSDYVQSGDWQNVWYPGKYIQQAVNSPAMQNVAQGMINAAGGPNEEQLNQYAYMVEQNALAEKYGQELPFPTPAGDILGPLAGGKGQVAPLVRKLPPQDMRAGITGAGALMKMGTGRHPGYGGEWWKGGKGAGSSLGQEARAARRAKQGAWKSSRKALAKKAKKAREPDADDNDFAQGGLISREGYADGQKVVKAVQGARKASLISRAASGEPVAIAQLIAGKVKENKEKYPGMTFKERQAAKKKAKAAKKTKTKPFAWKKEVEDKDLSSPFIIDSEVQESIRGGMQEGGLMSREGYAAGGIASRLVRKLLKRHKKNPEVESDIITIKSKIDDIDDEIGSMGDEGRGAMGDPGYGDTQAFTRNEIANLEADRMYLIEGLEEIDKTGSPVIAQMDEAGFPVLDILTLGPRYSLADLRASMKATVRREERKPKQEGGEIDEQMTTLMGETEQTPTETLLPDEEMEDNFVDYIVESTLSPEDTNYLEEALATDDRLSMIFDQVVETASEFSGSGPVEGPGTEVSDSIPARLSDGEFVITAKAADQIGPDNLQGMMEQAEMDADLVDRREMAEGGVSVAEDIDEDVILPQLGVLDTSQREMLKLQLSSNPRTQYRTVYG